MKLSGSYEIPTDKQSVWDALNSPEILQKCIPGCEEFKKNSDTSFTATATNKIGPFNASFTGEIELKDLKDEIKNYFKCGNKKISKNLKPFKIFLNKKYKMRKDCILLPISAVIEALDVKR